MKKPGAFIGGFVGASLTAPLIAVFYLARQLAGLPFPPFDLFDWMARVLPGRIITFGIDLMVSIIRSVSPGQISALAKTAEQLTAIAQFMAVGILAGMILFVVLPKKRGSGYGLVLVLAAVAAIPIALISLSITRMATVAAIAGGLWIMIAFAGWAATLVWVHRRLMAIGAADADAGEDFVKRIDRRKFIIRIAGATAVITVVGAGVGALIARRRRSAVAIDPSGLWSSNNPLPNKDSKVEPVSGTRPEFTPLHNHYRIDINTSPPEVNEQAWRLKIGGLVEKPTELTIDDLRNKFEPLHQFITLSCISNPIAGSLIGTTRWTGVSLQNILADVGLRENATHLRLKSADGFHEVVALESIMADQRIMLTYAWDGVPLKTEHGFPLRIYIPDRYGMKQPKWIESIDAIERWEEGYWVSRGWDRNAQVRATSVIDSVALDMMIAQADETTLVPIGGVAYAGARGISKVEVRVDDGEWREAQLRDPLSDTTWVIWRYDWPFQAGKHTFTVRCFDRGGAQQIETESPVHPSGATGLHRASGMY